MDHRRPPAGPFRLQFLVVCVATFALSASDCVVAGDLGPQRPADRRSAAAKPCPDTPAESARAGRDAYDRRPWSPPEPRAAVVAPPPIVKILRRGGHDRSARMPHATRPPAARCTAAGGFSPRAAQAVMIANAADIVRMCRWLL